MKLISQLEDNFKKDFHLSDEDLSDNLRNRLIHEVEKNLSNSDFSLSSLAQTLGYNMSYLSLQFKNLVGENFREFLLDKRLEKARLLLLASDYKIFEISNKVGILDENYFAKCFKKKKYGCTCSEFRKQKHDAF